MKKIYSLQTPVKVWVTVDQNGNYALNKLVGVRLTSSPALNMHYYNRGHTYRDVLIPNYLSFMGLTLNTVEPKEGSFQFNQIAFVQLDICAF